MKHISSIFKICTILLPLLTAGWLVGCTDDEFDNPGKIENGVKFSLEIPNIGIPKVSTRTMAGTGLASKEDEIKTVDLLVFDASSSPEVFLEWVAGTNITQDLTISTVAEFTAKLTPTNASTRIVVVANKSLSSMASDFAGKNKEQVMEMLTHSSTTAWKADGSSTSGYTPIPMYGETVVTKITSSMTLSGPVQLTRMLARIDVVNSASNFVLENIYLTNYNTAGYIAPGWNANGQVDDASIPNIPSDSGKQTGEYFTYTIENGATSYVGEIYTFEAAAAEDGINDIDSSRKDAVCLIVKGKYANSPISTYYRIDFLADNGDYIGLKRNYKYIINIQEANATGYASFGDALNSYRVMTNLNVRLITYGSQEKIRSVVYNGQYMLGVGEPEIELYQYYNNAYTVDVYTDSPGGWEASIPGGSWLTFNNGTNTATGLPDQDTNFSLLIPFYNAPVGSTRTETITLTAGRLTHEVIVKQSVKDPGMIRFMDAYGNVLDNGLFFPMNRDLEPQTVYVMWTTKSVKSWRQPRDEYYGGDIPITFDSFSPMLPADKNNKVPLFTGVQAFTMKPVSGGSDDWRWDVLYFDLYNDNNQYLGTQDFPINQGLLTFLFYDLPTAGSSDSYALELGPIHRLDLGSNVNWEITQVEEIGNTGLLGTTNQDIRVGTSNRVDKANIIPNWAPAVTHGTDLVAQEGRYYLNFPTGDWVQGKTGTVRVTFRNLMHTAGHDGIRHDFDTYERGPGSDDDYFPFYRTIDLILTGVQPLSYTTTETNPYFYIYPRRYTWDNGTGVPQSSFFTLAAAQAECASLGTGWRLPALGELFLATLYAEATGGIGLNATNGWFGTAYQNFYWSSSSYNYKYLGVAVNGITTVGEPLLRFDNTGVNANVRCIRDVTGVAESTKYPKVLPNQTQTSNSGNVSGVVIVSRDAGGGVNPSTLLASGATPGPRETKVPPKLFVSNVDIDPVEEYNVRNWATANKACTTKGAGWRLPTVSEIQLIWALGGTTSQFGYPLNWGVNYQKVNNMTWTSTENETGQVYTITPDIDWLKETHNKNALNPDRAWLPVRCVKSIN